MIRTIRVFLSLGILVVFILGVIQFKNSPDYDFFYQRIYNFFFQIRKNLEVIFENIKTISFPPRRPPYSFLEIQAKLEDFLPDIFADFSEEEWKEFWDLIYGTVEEDVGVWLKKKRYRSIKEIEDYLKLHYSYPFMYFRKTHWDLFWKIVFGKK